MIRDGGDNANCTVSLEFGRKLFRAEDEPNLAAGAVLELGAFADDYVDVYADGRLIARGVPIVVDGKLAVRVQESLAAVRRTGGEAMA